jgi:hypothetical protein
VEDEETASHSVEPEDDPETKRGGRSKRKRKQPTRKAKARMKPNTGDGVRVGCQCGARNCTGILFKETEDNDVR